MNAQALLDSIREQMAFRDGVQKVGIADILGAREFPALMEEYAAESAVEGLPPPQAKMENYGPLEWTGGLHSFAAALGGRLIGFITVLAPRLPHYNTAIAVAESFFVAAAHRKGGAGLRLLAAAEEQARAVGSPVLVVCAPYEGRLFEVLPRRGYVETNRVFTKKLNGTQIAPNGTHTALTIPAMSEPAMAKVRALETHMLATQPQIDLAYEHVLHAGVYDRTVLVPAGQVITGAPVKIETLLTIVGDVIVGLDGDETRVTGFAKIRAAAHRMGVFTAITDTYISMSFATDAKTVAEAEAQFTDEADRLASRRQPCPA